VIGNYYAGLSRLSIKRKAVMMLTQEPFCTFTLGNIGWMNHYAQQQAIGIN